MQIRDGGSRSAESPARAEPPSGQGFEPREFEAFRFTGADFDPASATAVLRYALDDAFEFEETIRFLGAGATAAEPDDARLRRARHLPHLRPPARPPAPPLAAPPPPPPPPPPAAPRPPSAAARTRSSRSRCCASSG